MQSCIKKARSIRQMGPGGSVSTFTDPLGNPTNSAAPVAGTTVGTGATTAPGASAPADGSWIAPAVGAAAGILSQANLGGQDYGDLQRPGMNFSNTAAGAGLGATVGSIVPGVGTAVGAGVGAGIGLGADTISYLVGKKKFEQEKRELNVRQWRDTLVNDRGNRDATGVFYMRNGGVVMMEDGGEVAKKPFSLEDLPQRYNADTPQSKATIQSDLMAQGYALPKHGADGVLGKETGKAVMDFQKDKGLKVDGIAGPETLSELQKGSNGQPAAEAPKTAPRSTAVSKRRMMGKGNGLPSQPPMYGEAQKAPAGMEQKRVDGIPVINIDGEETSPVWVKKGGNKPVAQKPAAPAYMDYSWGSGRQEILDDGGRELPKPAPKKQEFTPVVGEKGMRPLIYQSFERNKTKDDGPIGKLKDMLKGIVDMAASIDSGKKEYSPDDLDKFFVRDTAKLKAQAKSPNARMNPMLGNKDMMSAYMHTVKTYMNMGSPKAKKAYEELQGREEGKYAPAQMREGGEVNVPVELEDKEIVILKQPDGSYREVMRSDGFPSHEAGGKVVELPVGAQVFNRHLYKDVEDALAAGDWAGIDAHLVPARDAMLREAKMNGEPYSTGAESTRPSMGYGGLVRKYAPGGGVPPNGGPLAMRMLANSIVNNPGMTANAYAQSTLMPTGTDNQFYDPSEFTADAYSGPDTRVSEYAPPARLESLPGKPIQSMEQPGTPQVKTGNEPVPAYDDAGYPGRAAFREGSGTDGRRLESGDIHNMATGLNLMFAVSNAFKGGPPAIRLDTPSAHLAEFDSRPIRHAYTQALGALNTSQRNVAESVRSVGDVVGASGFATAGILEAQNQAAAQEMAGRQQVDFANANILNTVEGQRAGIQNQERAMNAEQSARDAAMRSEAISSNLNAAADNQLNRLQEEQMQEQARRNELISLEAMKLAAETDAFEGEDYAKFKANEQQTAFDAITKELGDKKDLSSPVYKDAVVDWEKDFEGKYQHPQQVADSITGAKTALEAANAMPDGPEKAAAVASSQAAFDAAQASADDFKARQLQMYNGIRADTYYEERRASELIKRTDENSLRERFRKERNIPKSDLNSLLNMLNNK